MNLSHAEEPVRCAGFPRCSNWRSAESKSLRNGIFVSFRYNLITIVKRKLSINVY